MKAIIIALSALALASFCLETPDFVVKAAGVERSRQAVCW